MLGVYGVITGRTAGFCDVDVLLEVEIVEIIKLIEYRGN